MWPRSGVGLSSQNSSGVPHICWPIFTHLSWQTFSKHHLQKGMKYIVNAFIIFKILLCINETQNHNPFLILEKFWDEIFQKNSNFGEILLTFHMGEGKGVLKAYLDCPARSIRNGWLLEPSSWVSRRGGALGHRRKNSSYGGEWKDWEQVQTYL